MVLRDYKAFIKGLSSNSQVSKQGTKTKHLVAITIALTLTFSILLMMPTINTTNNKTTTTTISIISEKQPSCNLATDWNYAIGDWVQSVAVSADGNYIAAGRGSGLYPYDGKVFLFDNSGNEIWNYTTDDWVNSVAVSADGNYTAAGGYDDKVYFFNRTDSHQWNYTTGGDVRSVAVSADGNTIAAGSNDFKVYFFDKDGYLWNHTTGGNVQSVAVSEDGNYIAAGSNDNKVYFFNQSDHKWNSSTGNQVRSVAISSDGSYIAAAAGDSLYFFDSSGSLLWDYTISGSVYSVDISSDGKRIAVGAYLSYDGMVFFLKDDGSQLWNYTTDGSIRSIAFSSDGNYIAAGSIEENVYFFNRTGYLLKSLTTGGWVESVSISADGYSVAAGSRDNNVYFFESPYIDHPDDITYEPLTTGHRITWYPVDDDPKNYYITKNEAVEDSGFWSGESITINVDGLSAGTYGEGAYYYFECTVLDKSGNSASDEVRVWVRNVDPTINSPGDFSYYEGDTGRFITWQASDENPSHYNITRNNEPVNDSSWDGGDIRENVDGLSVGTYNFECTVYDKSGNSRSDEVRVTVKEKEEAGIPWQFFVTVAVIVAALIYFIKRRKKG